MLKYRRWIRYDAIRYDIFKRPTCAQNLKTKVSLQILCTGRPFFNRSRYMEKDVKRENRNDWGDLGQSRSSTMSPFDWAHKTSKLCVSVLYVFEVHRPQQRVICRKSRSLPWSAFSISVSPWKIEQTRNNARLAVERRGDVLLWSFWWGHWYYRHVLRLRLDQTHAL